MIRANIDTCIKRNFLFIFHSIIFPLEVNDVNTNLFQQQVPEENKLQFLFFFFNFLFFNIIFLICKNILCEMIQSINSSISGSSRFSFHYVFSR